MTAVVKAHLPMAVFIYIIYRVIVHKHTVFLIYYGLIDILLKNANKKYINDYRFVLMQNDKDNKNDTSTLRKLSHLSAMRSRAMPTIHSGGFQHSVGGYQG